jgi:hypothetical protein
MKIYEKLSKIQQELKAPKNLYNKFGNYYYRNAEGILNAVKPLLNGLALVINDEPVVMGERYYIKATATLTDGSESVSAVAYAREDEQKKGMDGCQLTGACSSYARKYALNALLMIDDSKDSDDDSLSPKNPENEEKQEKSVSKPAPKPAAVPPVRVVPDPPAVVDIGTKVPAAEKPAAPKAEKTPVQQFLISAMKGLREARDITPAQNNKLFNDQWKILIERGLAPDKALEEYTMPEAESLIDAMWKCFSPEGTKFIEGAK